MARTAVAGPSTPEQRAMLRAFLALHGVAARPTDNAVTLRARLHALTAESVHAAALRDDRERSAERAPHHTRQKSAAELTAIALKAVETRRRNAARAAAQADLASLPTDSAAAIAKRHRDGESMETMLAAMPAIRDREEVTV